MPSELHYFPEYQLAFERFSGMVTLEEVNDVNQRFLKLLDEVDASVTTLVDLRAVEKYPASINQLREVLRVSGHEHIGWVVIVTDTNPMLKLAAAVITQVSVRGLRFIEGLHSPSNAVLPLDTELTQLLIGAK